MDNDVKTLTKIMYYIQDYIDYLKLKYINKNKKSKDIPETMQKLYYYEHERLVEEYDELSYKVRNKI